MLPRDAEFAVKNILENFKKEYVFSREDMNSKIISRKQSISKYGRKYSSINLNQFKNQFSGSDNLWSAIERINTKFNYQNTTSFDWDNYYVFPDLLNKNKVEYLDFLEASAGNMDIINNVSNYEIALNNLLVQLKSDHRRVVDFVLGRKGCGKSTFIKYLCANKFEIYVKNGIIPSRVEYIKLENKILVENVDVKTTIINSMVNNAFRDSMRFFLFSESELGVGNYLGMSPDEILKDYKEFCIGTLGDDEDYVDLEIEKIKRYRCCKTWVDRKDVLLTITPFGKQSFLKYCHKNGLRYQFIFDGFDLITAEEVFYFIEDKELLLRTIVEISTTMEGKDLIPLVERDFQYNCLIVLRKETYNRFFMKGIRNPLSKLINLKEDPYVVVAPSQDQIINVVANKIINNISEDANERIELKKAVYSFIKYCNYAIVKLVGEKNLLIDICNNNIRAYQSLLTRIILTFMYLILDYETDSVDKVNEMKSDLIVKSLSSPFARRSILKNYYRITGLLIHTKGNRVTNRVGSIRTARREAMPDYILGESSPPKGIIDNMMTYHYESNDFRTIMEKIWIVLILKNSDITLTDTQIKEKLVEVYNYQPVALRASLALLCRTNFIFSEINSNFDLAYGLEPLSNTVIDELMFDVVYIENYFHTMLLPQKIWDYSADCHQASGKIEWLSGSILNTFIFISVIRTIEADIPKLSKSYRISKSTNYRVVNSIVRIIEKDLRRNKDRANYAQGTVLSSAYSEINKLIKNMIELA